MRKLVAASALVCLFALVASAQEGGPARRVVGEVSEAEAERLLKSASNAERAWGAYLAGRLGLEQQVPALVGLLEDPALSGDGWEEGFLRQSVLDALIQLDAEVPAEKLMPFYQRSPAEVIILLARSPRENAAALLPLFVEEMPKAHWLAVGNLLAQSRAEGFAARLLGGLKIEASVYVFDSEGRHDFAGGVGGGCGGGTDGGEYVPKGFPPVYYYALVEEAVRGAVVFAQGRLPVHYQRTTSPGGRGIFNCSLWERDSLRVRYLAELLDTSEDDLHFKVRPWREVVCRDEEGCRRELARVRDEIKASHVALVARLVSAGRLAASDAAGLKPDISLEATDRRARRTFPLPSELKGVKLNLCAADCGDEEGNKDAGDATRDAEGQGDPP